MADKGKRLKFVELAERRTANAMRAIRVIGNLSNRSHYDYEDEDVRKIVAALSSEVDSLKRRFGEPAKKRAMEFKL